MRIFVSLLAVAAISQLCMITARADSSVIAPKEFTYTEIFTTMSNTGIPVDIDVKRVSISGAHKRVDRFERDIEITDSLTSRLVAIDPQRKTYTVHGRQRVINASDGTQTETEIPKRPAHDYYKALAWMPEDSTRLALKDDIWIQSQLAHGEKVTHVSADGTNVTTCWTAVESNRVLQVQSTWTPKGAKSPEVVIIRTAFDYSPILDKSIFSLVPPSGYELKSQAILGITLQND